MNHDDHEAGGARGAAGEYEQESGHERRRRLRSELLRRWRKAARHPRAADLEETPAAAAARRFLP